MGAQEGSIFDAHLLVLEDPTLLDEVVRIIQTQKVNAEHAFHRSPRLSATLAAIEDDYLRERATDMRDVTSRVLDNLLGVDEESDLRHLKEPCIIISHDLTPSETAQLDNARSWASPRTSAARPRTPPSWPGRCASRRWSA